jgi:AmiR/NasT family two-component response regulator
VEELRAEVTGLRRALQTQGVIEQAKGMLMMRFGLDADAAFALLVRFSQDHNRKVAAISTAIIDLGRGSPQLAQSFESLEKAVMEHPECAGDPAG